MSLHTVQSFRGLLGKIVSLIEEENGKRVFRIKLPWFNANIVPQNEIVIQLFPDTFEPIPLMTKHSLKSSGYQVSDYGVVTDNTSNCVIYVYGSEKKNFHHDPNAGPAVYRLMQRKGTSLGGKLIHYIGFYVGDDKLVFQSVYQFPEHLTYVSPMCIDTSEFFRMLAIDSEYIEKLPKSVQTVDLLFHHINQYPEKIVHTRFSDLEYFFSLAVRRNYHFIGLIENPSLKLKKEAIDGNIKALKYIKKRSHTVVKHHLKIWGSKGIKYLFVPFNKAKLRQYDIHLL